MQKINKIYRTTLQLVCGDYNSNNSISVYQKHLKHVAIKVCKSLMSLSPEFKRESYKNNPFTYNLINRNIWMLSPARSLHSDINSVHFQVSLLWNNPLNTVKESTSVIELKNELKWLQNTYFLAVFFC